MLVNLQTGHLVGVSGYLRWITSQGLCGEHVHRFHMFAILKVKLVIKPRIFSPVARQPALTWQEVCTQILARGLKAQMLQPSIKMIKSPRTQLWHILALCARVTFTFDTFSKKLVYVTRSSWWMYLPIGKFIDVFVCEIFDHKMNILWPSC